MSYHRCGTSRPYDGSVTRVSMTFPLAVTLAAVLVVGGCGSDRPESAPPARPAAPETPAQPADTPTPQASPTASAPAPTAAPRHGGRHKTGVLAPNVRPRRTPAVEHLLAAEDLPALAGAWTADDDDGAGAQKDPAVGACQKTGLGTIGALESAQRTYSADDARAVQVVARFADARSAWRAHEVLESWREDCAERLGTDSSNVGPLEEVAVPVGIGVSYRAAYRKHAAGLGILRTGAYLTVVEITADEYPDGWEPARVAVRRIARTFDVSG